MGNHGASTCETTEHEKKWSWIGDTLKRPSDCIFRQALWWNPQDCRLTRRPGNSWREDAHRTIQSKGYHRLRRSTWPELKRRGDWDMKRFVSGVCSEIEGIQALDTHAPRPRKEIPNALKTWKSYNNQDDKEFVSPPNHLPDPSPYLKSHMVHPWRNHFHPLYVSDWHWLTWPPILVKSYTSIEGEFYQGLCVISRGEVRLNMGKCLARLKIIRNLVHDQ